jgi:hypothetical protein
MTEEHITFSADNLKLEGILHLPQGEPPFPALAVCHPHSLHGGSMQNNVVVAICHALAEASIAALRFNFRGVGNSDGDFSEGFGEQDDVSAALDFLTSADQIDSDRIGLAGYSFGTKVALPVALRDDRVRAIALVSPFISDRDWENLKGYVKPKIFICGGDDRYIFANEVQHKVSELSEPNQFHVIPRTDHFWWGFEGDVANKVAAFFTTVFKIDIV